MNEDGLQGDTGVDHHEHGRSWNGYPMKSSWFRAGARNHVSAGGFGGRRLRDRIVTFFERRARPGRAGTDADLAPLLGELAWHSATSDSRIEDVSTAHLNVLEEVLAKHGVKPSPNLQVLEVAAYAHITGYQLREKRGAVVELFDISPSTLRLGRQLALEKGLPADSVVRTAGDFHQLPYQDNQFDVVYICSSLHHTWRWQRVLSEMMRVLAPEGTLFLENEPTRRGLCFYKFRTNRPALFTPFERTLDELGMIRTVAEPYPGSRPETLFHMVENQTMPLREILAAVGKDCASLDIVLRPEDCMGAFEAELLERGRENGNDVPGWLADRLTGTVARAKAVMSEADRGMGFGLPTDAEIHAMCRYAGAAVARLPADVSSREFRTGISELFGAPLRLVARKRGIRRSDPRARFMSVHPEIDGVVVALPEEIARLIDPGNFLVPAIQGADRDAIDKVFPPSDWTLTALPGGRSVLSSAVTLPRMRISIPPAGKLFVVLRMYLTFDGRPYRVAVCHGCDELSGFDVFQAESILLKASLDCVRCEAPLELTIRTTAADGGAFRQDSFRISFAGAFVL